MIRRQRSTGGATSLVRFRYISKELEGKLVSRECTTPRPPHRRLQTPTKKAPRRVRCLPAWNGWETGVVFEKVFAATHGSFHPRQSCSTGGKAFRSFTQPGSSAASALKRFMPSSWCLLGHTGLARRGEYNTHDAHNTAAVASLSSFTCACRPVVCCVFRGPGFVVPRSCMPIEFQSLRETFGEYSPARDIFYGGLRKAVAICKLICTPGLDSSHCFPHSWLVDPPSSPSWFLAATPLYALLPVCRSLCVVNIFCARCSGWIKGKRGRLKSRESMMYTKIAHHCVSCSKGPIPESALLFWLRLSCSVAFSTLSVDKAHLLGLRE